MRTIYQIAFFNWILFAPNLLAQTIPLDVPKENQKCRIALPYRADEIPNCTAETAAAYDFAFCFVSYIMASRGTSESDKSLGENSRTKAFERKGVFYANLSTALSDPTTFQKNVAFTKKYFESLSGKRDLYEFSFEYVGRKCGNLEVWHAKVLEELVQKTKPQPKEER